MNQSASQPPRQRRSPEQWQQIVSEWQQSGQSARAFCTARSISYASFCQWRKRLSAPDAAPRQEAAPGFIDLSTLASSRAAGWRIVLSLGNGVELRLSQG